jgi:hypothetical protein
MCFYRFGLYVFDGCGDWLGENGLQYAGYKNPAGESITITRLTIDFQKKSSNASTRLNMCKETSTHTHCSTGLIIMRRLLSAPQEINR